MARSLRRLRHLFRGSRVSFRFFFALRLSVVCQFLVDLSPVSLPVHSSRKPKGPSWLPRTNKNTKTRKGAASLEHTKPSPVDSTRLDEREQRKKKASSSSEQSVGNPIKRSFFSYSRRYFVSFFSSPLPTTELVFVSLFASSHSHNSSTAHTITRCDYILQFSFASKCARSRKIDSGEYKKVFSVLFTV